MFSQSSFRPLNEDTPPTTKSTSSSRFATPEVSAHTSPIDEEDEFDLGDPHFNRSRASSTRSHHDSGRASPRTVLAGQHGSAGQAGTTFLKPEEVGSLLQRLSQSDGGDKSDQSSGQVHAPVPRHPQSVNRKTPSKQAHPQAGTMFSRSFQDDALSPPSGGRGSRLSPSPSRHHQLTALSPLQAFSPLQSTSQPLRETSTNSEQTYGHSRSRSNSITKSLSRRQSLIANAEKWSKGMDDDDARGDAMSLFSRLTLVKAPAAEGAGLRRAKSSSALTPFANPAKNLDANVPATTARGPRRSFAASSFAGFSPMTASASLKSLPEPFSPHGPDAANRITHERQQSDNISIQRKTMSPEEVVDIARSLASPVVIPQGGFKGAELKRRKSAGSTGRRGTSETTSPEKPPLALEPVEYVQLDDETLLPFVDRPTEVKELSEHHSNSALFKLLKAAFPKSPLRQHWQALAPEEWYWDEFMQHLTRLSRIECPDYAWIFRARQAVRARSVALWEKIGVCLGCDGDLLNAGGEDGSPPSWGGLGLGEEGEYDPTGNQVWIEGLEAVDPAERERTERQFREEFGDIVEDEGEQASAGMTALLGTVGEEEEESVGLGIKGRQTTAQREASKHINPVDPMDSPSFTSRSLPRSEQGAAFSPYTPRSPSKSPGKIPTKERSKSFVGLQIMTSPVPQKGGFAKSPTDYTPSQNQAALPIFDRGPGSPLFPSSFSSLSVEPNLGRSASIGLAGGVKPVAYEEEVMREVRGYKRWSGLGRKPSGAGLSESAITFASESDYAHSVVGDHE